MDLKNKRKQIRWGWLAAMVVVLASCTVSYKFNGASIDYEETKTIQITPFPLRSAYVWAPMQSIFNNRLTDVFASQTRPMIPNFPQLQKKYAAYPTLRHQLNKKRYLFPRV